MLYYVDMDCANRALQSAAFPLTEEQVFTFQGIMDDAVVEAAAKNSGVNLSDAQDKIDMEPIPQETPRERRKRHRKEFWDGAAEVMMVDLFIDEFFKKKK